MKKVPTNAKDGNAIGIVNSSTVEIYKNQNRISIPIELIKKNLLIQKKKITQKLSIFLYCRTIDLSS
ncbi:hypothetical protein OX284_010930 [Flavobacterium sp. SUN046]|uniref:hypothetical protein n=1 Tax=Flavobacterium sp. SUN046 TaxID=3002440 RepID=UPI002DB7A143|nr:hypothetical protein [Flavobacterium sp. SUN046]MEC4049944.1 hypothetical protein [Flavobacterium sp. SUN046]